MLQARVSHLRGSVVNRKGVRGGEFFFTALRNTRRDRDGELRPDPATMHDATCPSFCGQEPAAGPIRDLHHVRGRRRARGSRPIPPVAPVSRGGPMPRWAIPPASSGTWPAPLYAASVPGVAPSTCLT